MKIRVIFVIIASLILTSCINIEKDAKKEEQNTISIDALILENSFSEKLKYIVERYNNENPNSIINLKIVDDEKDYNSALLSKMQEQKQPTIINLGEPKEFYNWQNSLEDLSDQEWVEYAFEGTLDGAKLKDKLFGMPMSIEGFGFILNNRIFSTIGVDVNKISSFSELEEAVILLNSKISNGSLTNQFPNLEAVFSYNTDPAELCSLHSLSIALSYEFESSQEAYEAKDVKFAYAESLQKLVDLQIKYSKDNSSAINDLANENVAIIQDGNWIYDLINEINPEVANSLILKPIYLNGVTDNKLAIGVPMYWCINNASTKEEKAVAKSFLNWLYTSDDGMDILVNEFNIIQPFSTFGGRLPNNQLSQMVLQAASTSQAIPWIYTGFPSDWGQNVFGQGLKRYKSQEIGFDEVVSESIEKWHLSRK